MMKCQTWVRWLVLLVLLVAIAVPLQPAQASSTAPAAIVKVAQTGGVDLANYCVRRLGYQGFGGNPSDAYSAFCYSGSVKVGIDMYDVCLWQYGGALPYPIATDVRNLYSWVCTANGVVQQPPYYQPDLPAKIREARQANVVGGVNVIFVCYYYRFADAKNYTNTADDWNCIGGGKANWNVNWPQTCIDVYGQGYTAVKVSNGIDGWRCYYYGVVQVPPTQAPPQQPNPLECPAAPASIGVGWTVYVSDVDPYPLRLRSAPGLYASEILKMPIRSSVKVVGGPVCANGYRWFQVRYRGRIGWAAEVGPAGKYNLVVAKYG